MYNYNFEHNSSMPEEQPQKDVHKIKVKKLRVRHSSKLKKIITDQLRSEEFNREN